MKASVVIGANYGDEGKGLMTDYLCRKHNADVVVRFNGGGQAGHTVVTPEGQRHVFSHIGSGYYAGVPTYLSEHFVLNPIIFRSEFENLKIPNGYKIYVDNNCIVTTPWDMIANQVREEARGNSRHGSCGVGFGTTIERNEKMPFVIGDYSLKDPIVACQYWKDMLVLPTWASDVFNNHYNVNRKFNEDMEFMFDHINFILPKFEYAIFEGAQGLALDQFMGNFPYVTRSNTGMRNVVDMQRKMHIDLDEIVYVSRTYETRHGADPYFGGTTTPLKGCADSTNVENDWQGVLRYKNLNYDKLYERINTDVYSNNIGRGRVKIAFTHNDQIKVNDYEAEPALFDYNYISNGETFKDIEEII